MDPDDHRLDVAEVTATDGRFSDVLQLAATVLNQDRYLLKQIEHAQESHIVGAFDQEQCVGFLRFVIQELGRDAGCTTIVHGSAPLREGFVEAFGVEPSRRRSGIGTQLQTFAADYCRHAGCHRMRSLSPAASTENYALKIRAGYTLHPSSENDSYYFAKLLR